MKVYRKNHPDSTKRREAVIERLNAQLISGVKTAKGDVAPTNGHTHHIVGAIPLTEADKVRINKELVTLKLRV